MISVYNQKTGGFWCVAAIEKEKICATSYSVSLKAAVESVLKSLPYNKPFQTEEKPIPLAKKIFHAMGSILEGKDVAWDFELDNSHLSGYTRKVLNCLAKVPIGYFTTYGALAKTAGGGPRAVGQIMASNSFAPLVPCHRVIKSDFSIGGFGSSLSGHSVKLKRQMLEREDRGFDKSSRVETACGSLEVFPVRFLRKDSK